MNTKTDKNREAFKNTIVSFISSELMKETIVFLKASRFLSVLVFIEVFAIIFCLLFLVMKETKQFTTCGKIGYNTYTFYNVPGAHPMCTV